MPPQANPAQPAAPRQVSRGLNLTLELEDPRKMPELLQQIMKRTDSTRQALRELHFVHFARFLPLRDQSALLVITEFDGPLEPYVMDFVIAIGDVFDMILGYVRNRPTLPVRENVVEFMDFVRANNQVFLAPGMPYAGDYPLYSAYPERTVIDILGPRSDLPPPVEEPAAATIDLADVQGNILQGYNASIARHFAVRFDDEGVGRAFLDVLVNGDESACPRVTSASVWTERPLYFLNVGVTAEGLKALGVPRELRHKLPRAFLEGPADRQRAARNGDTGASAPEHWELGSLDVPVHLLVSLYADAEKVDSMDEFRLRSSQLTGWFNRYGLQWITPEPETRLLENREQVHFGYREGMAQPRIAGVPNDGGPDLQPRARAGEFLLGDYADVYGGRSLGAMPRELCQNATFAAVRVLEQDVAAFERLLDTAAQQTGQDREWIAAKLMGRWRNGTPLTRAPAAPEGRQVPLPVAESDFNAFDYAPSHAHPDVADDHEGLVCPVGSHARRMNPRSAMVAGRPYTHRLIRRGMPYGPAWDPAQPQPRRGLFGLFLCADLERQFEFLMQEWANGDTAASGIRGTQDPFIGSQSLGGEFRIPMPGAAPPLKLQVPRLVTTRGSLYLLVPGLAGLRYLARGDNFAQGAGAAARPMVSSKLKFGDNLGAAFHPRAFDPKDPAFLANPYPYYAEFRQSAPVALVKHGKYQSWWVFSHELVTEACDRTADFLKKPASTQGPRGLFFMDPPRHTEVRTLLDPLFDQAIQGLEAGVEQEADAAIADILAGPEPVFDLVARYSNRVTRNVFMRMFGVPQDQWAAIGRTVETILRHHDQMLPDADRAPANEAGLVLFNALRTLGAACPAQPVSPELLCRMARQGHLHEMEVALTASNFALGGYLSTDFLVSSAVHNLLARPELLARFRAGDAEARRLAVEELKRFDAPFQMADRYTPDREVKLGDRVIPPNSLVTVVYGSANHDERKFGAGADTLDFDRTMDPGSNYVFGHGIHHCIGAPLVAKVAPVVIGKLLDRLQGLQLDAGQPERYQDPYFRAFARLPLRR